MKEIAYSDTMKKEYVVSDGIRIVNMKQLAYYWINGVEIFDIYPSRDLKTGEPILVGVINKKQSYPYYKEWLANKPKDDVNE